MSQRGGTFFAPHCIDLITRPRSQFMNNVYIVHQISDANQRNAVKHATKGHKRKRKALNHTRPNELEFEAAC